MKTKEIKSLLKKAKVTQDSIAIELGVKPPAVSQVIHKRQTSYRIQKRICELFGKTYKEVWE